MKFDKKGEKIDSYNSGLMKDIGGHGPRNTVLANDYGGESVELGKQMGANRDFLKGPGSKHRNSEGTFNVEHSGIVKQGMDSGIYKMQQSGMHKMGGDEGGAPFHVIEARNTGVDTLLEGQEKGENYKSKAIDEGTAGLEETIEGELGGGSPKGDTEIYSGEDLEKVGGKDYSSFGQDTVDKAMEVDTDLTSDSEKKKKGFGKFLEALADSQ